MMAANDATAAADTAGDHESRRQDHGQSIVGRLIPWLFRLVCCLCVVVGFLLSKKSLHTHEECDMTFSRRQFLPLAMSNASSLSSSSLSSYRLFKFIDQRDPRHQRFLRTKEHEPLDGTDWCNTDPRVTIPAGTNDTSTTTMPTTTVAVLYVPGHGGSYQQARSLGAHGIQLTGQQDLQQQRRVLAALQHHQWSGATDTASAEKFVFDVYAVDFHEEGGALHGDLVIEQSLFVAQAVRKLVQDCQLDSVVVVGHSMGGLAARLAPILVPATRPWMRNVVTLATPHASVWNPALRQVHQLLHSDDTYDKERQHNTAIVSIVGGLRDEMIQPEACYLNSFNSVSIMATDVMRSRVSGLAPTLGMDHRSIVWCHNLLLSVRDVIFVLVQTDRQELPAVDRVTAVQESWSIDASYDFLAVASDMKTALGSIYGTTQAILMEAAQLSNIELLIMLYTYLGAWRCIVRRLPGLVAASTLIPVLPLVAIINCRLVIESTIALPTIVLTVGVADSVFVLLRMALWYCMRGFWLVGRSGFSALRPVAFLFVLTACGAQLLYVVVSVLRTQEFDFCSLFPLLALASFVFVPVLIMALTVGLKRQSQSTLKSSTDAFVSFGAWGMVVLPLLVTGEVYFILIRGKASSTSSNMLLWRVSPVVWRVLLGYVQATNPRKSETANQATVLLFQMIRVCLVLGFSPYLFKSGGSFFAGHLLVTTSLVDSIEILFPLLVGGNDASAWTTKIE